MEEAYSQLAYQTRKTELAAGGIMLVNNTKGVLRRRLRSNGTASVKHHQSKISVKAPVAVLVREAFQRGLSQLRWLFLSPQGKPACNHNTPDRSNTAWRGRDLYCTTCGKQIQIEKRQMDFVLNGTTAAGPGLFSAAATATMVYAAAAITGSWLVSELCSLVGSSPVPESAVSPGLQYANDFFAMYSNGIVYTLMQNFVHGRSILMSALDNSLLLMLIYLMASLLYFASKVEKSERPKAVARLYLSLAALMLMFPVPLISWLQHHVKDA